MIDITRVLAGFAGLEAVEVCVLLLAMAESSVGVGNEKRLSGNN